MAKYKFFHKNDASKVVFEGDSLARANLSFANLSGADLSHADLSRADLSFANLSFANLRGANLSRANIDYASWSLHCGSFNVVLDIEQKKQLLIHVLKTGGDPLPDQLQDLLVSFCKDASLLSRHDIVLEEDR